jgi:hypothetical protein
MTTSGDGAQHLSRASECSPFIRVNNDVICEIYLHLVDNDMPFPEEIGKPGSLGWVRLTHVCRRWRDIGLSLAAIWAGDSLCALPKAFPITLERARDCPLTFRRVRKKNELMPLSKQQLDAVYRHISRITTLCHTHPGSWSSLLHGKCLPLLKTLDICGLAERWDFIDLQQLEATSLITLSFRNMYIPFVAHALRSFSLYSTHVRKSVVISIPDILDAISQSPLLERLIFVDSLDERTQCAPGRHKTSLMHLRYMELHGTGTEYLELWKYVDVPLNVSLKLSISHVDSFLPVLTATRSQSQLPSRSMLRIKSSIVLFALHKFTVLLEDESNDSIYSVSFSVIDFPDDFVSSLFPYLASNFLSEHINVIDLSGWYNTLDYRWLRNLVISLPSSTRLLLNARSAHLKTLALMMRSQEVNTERLCMPHLAVASLLCVHDSNEGSVRREWEALIAFLNDHQQNGQRVCSLSLIGEDGIGGYLIDDDGAYTVKAQKLVDVFSDTRLSST